MKEEKRTYVKWTDEKVREEARKYKTRGEFFDKCGGGYKYALKNNMLDELFVRVYESWTDEKVREEAKKYRTRNEFYNKCSGGYDYAWKKHMLDDLFGTTTRKPIGYWTDEKVRTEAAKYNSRSEFYNKCRGAYNYALKNNMLDELFGERVTSNFHDFIYVYEFPNNVIYVGRSIKPKERDYQHIFNEDSVSRYVKEHNNGVTPKMQIIEECENATIGAEREQYWMDWYKNNGYTLLNKAKGGGVGSIGSGKWTDEKVRTEAAKYNSRSEFKNKCGGGYMYAYRNNMVDELFGYALEYWDSEKVREEAKKYKTRSEFYNKCRSAYGYAWRNNILDVLFPTTKQAA